MAYNTYYTCQKHDKWTVRIGNSRSFFHTPTYDGSSCDSPLFYENGVLLTRDQIFKRVHQS